MDSLKNYGSFSSLGAFSPKKKYTQSVATPQSLQNMSSTGKPVQVPTTGVSTVQNSSNGATAPVNPAVKTPQAQKYLASISATPTPQTPTQTPLVGNVQTPSGATVNTQTGGLIQAPKVDPQQGYRDAFQQYISALQPSSEESQARKYLSNLTLQQKKDQEEALNRGESLGFATGEAQRVNRNNAFAIEGAASAVDALTAQRQGMTEAQKARMDFEKSLLGDTREQERFTAEQQAKTRQPFELGEGQSRYEFNPETGKYEQIANVAKTYSPKDTFSVGEFSGTLSPLAQAVQNGTISIDKLPSAQRSQIAAELATSGIQSPRQQSLQSNIDVVDELLKTDTDAITGIGQNPLNYIGVANARPLNLFNQLKGILSLENREKLKGSGAISDFEFKVLAQAATSLGRNLNNKDFKSELQKVKDVFEGRYRLTEGQNPQQNIAPDEEAELLKQGFTKQQIDAFKGTQSFKSVGNTTASIPKTSRFAYVNNNPGNLRFAGQSGAVKGENGFAKFKTPADGVTALENQIKLDASRNLTLAQFVGKYAPPTENDTNKYIQDIIKITGAQKNTSIKNIDLRTLVKAVAKKESGTIIS